mgnify:CR=1 FL=1
MKNRLLFCLLILCIGAKSQTQDLNTLSTGKLINFHAIYLKENNLYGYLGIYSLGNLNEETKKFEYVLLDKNLNKVINKEFVNSHYTTNFSGYFNGRGELILDPHYIWDKKFDKSLNLPYSVKVDITKNLITKNLDLCFKEERIIVCDTTKTRKERQKEIEELMKANDFVERSDVWQRKDENYFAYTYKDMGKYTEENRIIKFDKNKQKLWEYKFNENGDKKNSQYLYPIKWGDELAYFIMIRNEKTNTKFDFLVLNMDDGKIDYQDNIQELKNYREGKNLEEIIFFKNSVNSKPFYENDSIFKVYGFKFAGGYSIDGIYQLQYDKKKKSVVELTDYYYNKYYGDNGIGMFGRKLATHYLLKPRDIFFNDGGVPTILYELLNGDNNNKTDDLVAVSYQDSEFVPSQIKFFEKEKSKDYGADYLFSQPINEGKDVAFFYRDKVKDKENGDKNWILYINTVIDGQFKQEQIPISSKNYSIYPYVAKEGYILLYETNKENKDEKYNQIRLERLNY